MKKIRLSTALITCILLCSCAKEVTQEELIQAAIELKLETWRKEQINNCRTKIMEDADRYVDSLLLVTSLDSKLDTIPKPGKPVKPVKPPFKKQPDSLVKKG